VEKDQLYVSNRFLYVNSRLFQLQGYICDKNLPAMYQRIAHLALVVKDYDEAIQFYTEKLGFTLLEDTPLSEVKRWVLVAPPGAKECCLLLAKAANDEQLASVGNQTGGRVFLFLFTDDFRRDYNKLLEKEVHFVRPPKEEEYGTVAVFEDLYGNLWDLVQPKEHIKGYL
jgi:catechol 2,3-dioxygenase-like lactoylglutathione lyase family enzyme